nr:cation:proton antiporter [Pseudenhygromyxa sp. WMMC2535]
MLVALAVLAALLITKAARKIHIPPAVGYILFGLGLRGIDGAFGLVSPESAALLELLGELGVAALLFRVGLESELSSLLAELPRALLVWLGDVCCSALLGFFGARLLGLELVPALFVAVAFSATSIGLSVSVWQDAKRLDTPLGALLIDVAELDDLSAVLLTALLIVAAPALAAGDVDLLALTATMGWMLAKVLIFAAACWLFSRYLEERLSRLFIHGRSTEDDKPSGPTAVLFLVGTCFAIAALAESLGFSAAVGALFAGLMFSRDPEAVRAESSFEPIHALLTPFFFLDIGFAVDLAILPGALGLGALLLVFAALGKFVGVGGVVAPQREYGWRVGAVMGVSMIPRAEIALVVARMGNRLGEWAVPDRLYGALVLVSASSAILSPLILQRLFSAWSAHLPAPHRASAPEPPAPQP